MMCWVVDLFYFVCLFVLLVFGGGGVVGVLMSVRNVIGG